MNTDSVLSTLLRYVNGQYKKDTNYDIALALLTHYSVIPEKTINELSELCFVSPASISRFVKLIGFHSFQEFKNACLNTLDISKTDYSPQIIKADKIILANGSVPIVPPMFPYDKKRIITSDEVLGLSELPESMLIIGGGVIGCEIGQFFSTLGTEVTIVQRGEQLLPFEDKDVV